MAKFWPLHHYDKCMGENGRKTLSTAHWRGGMSTCTKHRLGCELRFVPSLCVQHLLFKVVGQILVHHYDKCMGENRRKILSTAWEWGVPA